MILPRYYSCPSVKYLWLSLNFEVNLQIIFRDGYKVTVNIPLKLIRSWLLPVLECIILSRPKIFLLDFRPTINLRFAVNFRFAIFCFWWILIGDSFSNLVDVSLGLVPFDFDFAIQFVQIDILLVFLVDEQFGLQRGAIVIWAWLSLYSLFSSVLLNWIFLFYHDMPTIFLAAFSDRLRKIDAFKWIPSICVNFLTVRVLWAVELNVMKVHQIFNQFLIYLCFLVQSFFIVNIFPVFDQYNVLAK